MGNTESKKWKGIPHVFAANAEDMGDAFYWLTDPASRKLLDSIASKKKRVTLGLVVGLKSYGETTDVSYVGLYGITYGFRFKPNDKKFADAPQGFRVGDIILNSFTHGLKFESIKPVDFSDEVDLQVRERFRGLDGKLQRRSK